MDEMQIAKHKHKGCKHLQIKLQNLVPSILCWNIQGNFNYQI